MKIPFLSIVVALLIGSSVARAQDYSWWNSKHHWDGYTSWSSYLIYSPGFMGPNALPVPKIQTGHLPGKSSLEAGIEGHYSKGDQTANLFTELFFPLFSKRAGLGISYVPVEAYRTDTLTRDMRRSREYDPRGFSMGDVYFSTYVQLLEEKERIPDLLLTVNLKTASGTNLEGARHTDSPGYYFDVSAGKTLLNGEGKLKYLRAYAMLGFLVFQTNLVNNMQNDAFQYGTGFVLNFGRFRMDQQLGGYLGYLNNGDRPLVYRMNLTYGGQKRMDLKVRFQQGICDFPYSSLRISTLVRL